MGVDAATATRALSALGRVRQLRVGGGEVCRVPCEVGDLARLLWEPGEGRPSLGSFGHGARTCRPCAFWVKGKCAAGILCGYCHILHERHRVVSRARRARARAAERELSAASALEPQLLLWTRLGSMRRVVVSL